jgi:hypothetical protein
MKIYKTLTLLINQLHVNRIFIKILSTLYECIASVVCIDIHRTLSVVCIDDVHVFMSVYNL